MATLLSSTGSSAGATGTGAGAGTGGAARAKLTHPSQPQRRRWARHGAGAGGSSGGGGDDSDDEAAHEASGEPRAVDPSRSLWAAAVHNKADAFASHERPIEDVKEVVVQPAATAADGGAAPQDGSTQPLQTQTQTVLLVPQGITISSTAGGKGLLATRTGPLAPVDRFTLGGGTRTYQYATPPAPAPGGGAVGGGGGGGTAVAGGSSTTTTTTVTAGAARPKYRNAPAPVASSSSSSSSSGTAPAPWQEPAPAPPPANIHFDKRVARGLTCTVKPVAGDGRALTADEQKRAARERSQARIAEHLAHREYLLATGQIRPQLQAVAYLHENIVVPKVRVAVDTTVMLTEPAHTLPVAVADTQTDAFESPPPSPTYHARKTGVDKHTQVDNALVFAFDEEVSAILEVLSTKTLEQALTEVREEEELRHVRALKRDVEARNAAEAARIADMEKAERAVVAAKDAIVKRSHDTVARERTVQNKIFAMRFARAYVSTLQSDVFGSLERAQYLFDPATHQTERFLPALYASAQHNVDTIAAARTFADTLLSASLQRVRDAKDEQAAAAAAEAARARAAADELARRRAPIQLYLTCVAVSPDPVGPIGLTGESTVADVQDAVVAWMGAHLPNAPARSALRFLWGGRELHPDQTLHSLGVQTLGTMQMRVEKDAVQLEVERMQHERAAKAAAEEAAAKKAAEDDAKAAAADGDGDGDEGEPEDD